jgi:hypothetical protein
MTLINTNKERRTSSFSCRWNEFAPQLPYWLVKAKQREERLRDGGAGGGFNSCNRKGHSSLYKFFIHDYTCPKCTF